MDKVELFEKAKGEILDELINLSQIKPRDWSVLIVTQSHWLAYIVMDGLSAVVGRMNLSGNCGTSQPLMCLRVSTYPPPRRQT